jgi:hypothetical protein
MTQIVQGSLVMIGLNTSQPLVYWNGKQITNIKSIHTMWEEDELRVGLRVTDIDPELMLELQVQGIKIKKEKI